MRSLLASLALLCAPGAFAQPAQAPARPWETWQPPAVVLPNPNGFDTYLKAFALKDELDLQYHVQKPNLAVPSAAPASSDTVVPDQWGEGPPDRPIAERVALYVGVYKLARQALAQECRIPPPKSYYEREPYFGQFRAMARLFRMESHVHFEKGQFRAAADSALDCVYMAQDVTSEAWVLPYVVGSSCEAIGMRALDEAIPKLDAAECKAALRRLERVEPRRLPLAQILEGEETFQRVVLKELMADPEKMRDFFQSDGQDPMSESTLRALHDRLMPVSWQLLGEYYDRVLRSADLPYPQREKNIEPPRDLFVATVAPFAPALFLKDASTRTASLLRQLQLAARWYALERGHLPATLTNLVPDYIPSIPDDPFGTGPLKSKLQGDTLLIYSVGPDCIDDGGKAIEGVVRADSKGDIVVRVEAKG